MCLGSERIQHFLGPKVMNANAVSTSANLKYASIRSALTGNAYGAPRVSPATTHSDMCIVAHRL